MSIVPHVVVTGPLAPGAAVEGLAPATEREEGLVLRIVETYVASKGNLALVDAVVVAEGKPTQLLLAVAERPDGIVVRIADQAGEVERTEAVQRLVAWVGRRIHDAHDGLGYGPTNLGRFLEAKAPGTS